MKKLLVVTAVVEVGAGLALLCCPSATVALLLGSGLDTPAALTLGRIAGAALFALSVACWLAHYDAQSSAASGLVSAMAFYNFGAVVILSAGGVWSRMVGIALWPVVVLHAVMTVWCITRLLGKSRQTSERGNEPKGETTSHSPEKPMFETASKPPGIERVN